MAKNEKLFQDIAAAMSKKNKAITLSNLFGKPSIKVDGKPFACYFQDEMVFKLQGDDHAEAIGLKGAKLFDPSGTGRAMKEWVQVPAKFSGDWADYAAKALKYVESEKKKK